MGKREEHKATTRAALQAAADRLFAAHGFVATTVRDIAEAAGVTERTFFRYFASKEDLVLDEALSWLPLLARAIRAQPASEPPFGAVREALRALAADLASAERPAPLWMFSAGPPAGRLRSPGTLLQIEQAITDALAGRASGVFHAELVARVSVALVRSVLIHDHAAPGSSVGELLDDAFALVSDQPHAVS